MVRGLYVAQFYLVRSNSITRLLRSISPVAISKSSDKRSRSSFFLFQEIYRRRLSHPCQAAKIDFFTILVDLELVELSESTCCCYRDDIRPRVAKKERLRAGLLNFQFNPLQDNEVYLLCDALIACIFQDKYVRLTQLVCDKSDGTQEP